MSKYPVDDTRSPRLSNASASSSSTSIDRRRGDGEHDGFDGHHSARPPLRDRAGTVSSMTGFDYATNMLPLTLSGEDEAQREDSHDEHKHVGWAQGTALVVGMQVGSGIFSSPGVVVAEVGSSGASLLVWVISGLLAWTGASSFAELGCAIPLSGGAQAYLNYAFGPLASYLFTWAAVSTLKPASSAIISLIFGEYVNRMIYHALHAEPDGSVPEWTFKVTAIIAITIVTFLNLVSRTMGTSFSVIITTVKIASLVFVFILGLITLIRDGTGPALAPSSLFTGTSTNPGNYALALYSGLWAFDGWDQCNFVAGEMHSPERDLPRTIHGSMILVIVLFLSANISYFVVLDPAVVASSNTVALDFGQATLGKIGAVVFSVLVAISCFGALSNGFYTTARLIYASSRDRFLPEIFGRLHHRRRTPDNAMALQAGLTVLFVCFGGGFRSLLNLLSVTGWTFYLLTVLGLLLLRVKEPHLNRPYRTYIFTPIIFCIVAAFLLLMPIFAAPLEALAAVVFTSAGVPMYYLTVVSARQSRETIGWRDRLRDGWEAFRVDIDTYLPARWRGSSGNAYRPVPGVGPGRRVFDASEEDTSMLRRDTVEMRQVR